MDTPFEICRTCKTAKPLTSKFWYRNSASKTGFSLHCRECDRKYSQARKHGEATHRGKKKSEALHYDNEPFKGFEAEALKDKRKTLAEPAISIYEEI